MSRPAALALLALELVLGSGPAEADMRVTGDVQVTGQAGIGTVVPRARVETRMSASDEYALKVSSQNGALLLGVDKTGRVGVGISSPGAWLDVQGSGDSGDLGLQLRVGNSTSSFSSVQMAFGTSSTETYRHSLRTRHVAGQDLGNAIDFFLWRSTGQPAALGSYHVLSLQAIATASSGSVHVKPAGTPDVELEVSDGTTTGGGAVHRAASLNPSSRGIKTEINYLGPESERQAYEDVKALRHAYYRYQADNPNRPPRRGLIFEEAPRSIQGAHKTVVLNDRVLNLEMALKEVNRQIQTVEAQVAELERRRR